MHEPLAKQTAARQKCIDDKAMDPFNPYTPSKRLAAGPPVRTAEDAQAVALKAVAFVAAAELTPETPMAAKVKLP